MLQEDPATREMVREVVSGFSLYNPDHGVNVYISDTFSPGSRMIQYRTKKQNIPWWTTHFELQVDNDSCYLLEIEVEEGQRGKGIGKELYGIVENVARKCGCRRVVMTASGNTVTGKTRKEYAEGLGYREIKDLEVEKII